MAHAGEAVRATRTAQGLTIRQLADRAQVSYSMLAQVERGQRTPTTRLLKAITDALGEHLAESLRGDAA